MLLSEENSYMTSAEIKTKKILDISFFKDLTQTEFMLLKVFVYFFRFLSRFAEFCSVVALGPTFYNVSEFCPGREFRFRSAGTLKVRHL